MYFDRNNWLANVKVFMSNHDDSLSNYNFFCHGCFDLWLLSVNKVI